MTTSERPLAIIATHPVQYQAQVFRALHHAHRLPVHVIYASDFSLRGYFDSEFQQHFQWDRPLVYDDDPVTFLSRCEEGGAQDFSQVSAHGLGPVLDRLTPAAVLLTGYSPNFHRQAFLAAQLRRIPILFRAETTDHTNPPSWLRDQLRAWFYARCRFLLPIGTRSFDHYRRLNCPQERLIQSPYCVDESTFRCTEADREEHNRQVRQELDIAADRTVVLFSGKLSTRKGPQVLVEALGALPDQLRRQVLLLLLGQGALKGELQTQARDKDVDLRLVGFQNQSRLSRYYNTANVFCLPSLTGETWGLVVNEAMLHGLPCVVSDAVGCAPDLVLPGQTGAIAQAGDVTALATALQECIRLAGRPETANLCRTTVARFSTDAAAAGIATAFQTLTPTSTTSKTSRHA